MGDPSLDQRVDYLIAFLPKWVWTADPSTLPMLSKDGHQPTVSRLLRNLRAAGVISSKSSKPSDLALLLHWAMLRYGRLLAEAVLETTEDGKSRSIQILVQPPSLQPTTPRRHCATLNIGSRFLKTSDASSGRSKGRIR